MTYAYFLATEASDMAKNDEKEQDGQSAPPTTLSEQASQLGGDGPIENVQVTHNDAPSSASAAAPRVDESVDVTGEDAEAAAKREQEIAALEAERLDPVTNQRDEDFLPTSTELDDRTRDLTLGERRATGVAARVQALSAVTRARRAEQQRDERNKKALDDVKKQNPLPKGESVMIDPATYRARSQAVVLAQARALTTNRTIPGGRYYVNGELVNANGDLIDKNGKILEHRSL